MKRQLMHTALIATTIMGSGLANAHNNAGSAGHTFEDRARVTSVKEITKRTRTRTPRKECWNEQVQTYNNCSNNSGSYQEYDHHSSHSSGSYNSRHSGGGSGDYQEGRYDGTVGAVAGGAIGGAIGHQFGKGRGKKAATIVGALAGAVIGSRAATKNGPSGDYYPSDQRNDGYVTDHSHGSQGTQYSHTTRCEPTYKTVRKCRTIYDDSYTNTVVGYRVTYRYKGRTYETRTKNRPGRFIRLRVTIQPIDE